MSQGCLMRRGEKMSSNKVSVSVAAKMVGVSRATFYRHIDEKSISTEQDDKGNKVIDVAELVRVYGNQLKTLEDVEKAEKAKKKKGETGQDSEIVSTELELMREKLKNLETERERERKQLSDQIGDLRSRLEKTEEQRIKAEEQKDRLTLMLTDQRSDKEKIEEKEKSQEKKFSDLEATIQELKSQQEKLLNNEKKGFFARLFGT